MDHKKDVLISVIIPVKNGDTWIDACIRGIMGQTLFSQCEIIVIDSGSTDGTLEALEAYPVRLYQIPPESFNHGETRNFGVSLAKGKFIALTVQDAVPSDDQWLNRLYSCFTDDAIAGVCGRQAVPHHPDKNPMDWYRPASAPTIRRVQFPSPEAFEALSPVEKKNACLWDNVTAMYRKEVLLQIPFRPAVFAEDIIWSKEALLAGYAIVYNPQAKVYHYHFENREYIFKRTLTTLYFRYTTLGFVPIYSPMTVKEKLSMINRLMFSGGVSFRKKLSWFKYNVERRKTIVEAYSVFTQAMSKGDKELSAVHERYCGKPPVPVKLN
ncbi:glycosyltransferase family 2 protein [Pseudoflavitalea rhizosphaerae]|uniref:glycosyltransferase family 2 protein n=1 Tax=Pseudoflavitalea rhizosphaerae TaxID=1884793 RepID=UPI001F49D93B|nr:glycosyltransferase [Pseudoflavitalea rhizosphaerae]